MDSTSKNEANNRTQVKGGKVDEKKQLWENHRKEMDSVYEMAYILESRNRQRKLMDDCTNFLKNHDYENYVKASSFLGMAKWEQTVVMSKKTYLSDQGYYDDKRGLDELKEELEQEFEEACDNVENILKNIEEYNGIET